MPIDRLLNELIENELRGCFIYEEDKKCLKLFIARANLELAANAIKELRGSVKKKNGGKLQEGSFIKFVRTYNRKLAEQANLYPIFHIFESSFKMRLAAWMEGYYGSLDWWQPIYFAAKAHTTDPAPYRIVTSINGKPITTGTARTIYNLLQGIDGQQFEAPKSPYVTDGTRLFMRAKLSDIEELIFEQWTEFKTSIPGRLADGAPLDENVFKSMFKRVRDARNDCYHHREVPKRQEIAKNAEHLLDLIDVHLESKYKYASEYRLKPLVFTLPIDERHGERLSADTYNFSIDVAGQTKQVSVSAGAPIDAIIKALAQLPTSDQDRLTSVSRLAEAK